MGATIKVKYNGTRFPRIVAIQGGKKTSFLADRREIVLNEYDALLLLKSNTRVNPEKWEFTIDRITEDKPESIPGGWSEKEKESDEKEKDVLTNSDNKKKNNKGKGK